MGWSISKANLLKFIQLFKNISSDKMRALKKGSLQITRVAHLVIAQKEKSLNQKGLA